MSCTINYETKAIQYATINCRIEDIDLGLHNLEEVDQQLENFDIAADKAFNKIKTTIKAKLKRG